MDIKRLSWKIFSIHKDEFSFALPLFLLYFLSGSFFAVGQIFSETIFLKTYGAKGFSRFFVQNGIAIIIAGIFYNYYLLKLPLRRGYIYLISFITALIVFASLAYKRDYKWMPFYIYMANYLFTVFLDIHFFNYAFQHLTIRNSKRILPFLMGGGKLGGILAGILIFYVFSKDISRYGMLVWSINGALILIPILLFKTAGAYGAGKARVKANELLPNAKFIDNLIRNVKSSISSSFFIYAVLSVFLVSILNQISEYYFAKIFNESFATKNELSAFLSLYTLSADFITLILQLFIVSKIINAFGVRMANFVYPASFFSLIAVSIAFPNLIAGILLRFFRKNLSAIVRTPVFNIILAASPRDRMAEVKSFISAIVYPAGMIAGGIAILLIYKKLSPWEGYALAISLGLIFIILTHFQNRSYIRSLADRIKFDSHLKEDEEAISANEYSELLTDHAKIEKNLNLIEALFNSQPSLELAPVLSLCYERLSNETKENILNLIRTGKSDSESEIIGKAIADANPGIRSIALSLLSERSHDFRSGLLKGTHPKMLKGERYAVSLLLGADESNKEIRMDKSAIDKLIEIKNGVLRDELESIEFVMLVQGMPYQYFLNHLYELTIKKRDMELFKCMIPFADKLTRRRIIKILYIFRNAKQDYIVRFIMLSKSAEQMDFAMLLDYSDISIEYMKQLYHYDEKTLGIFINRLFQNRAYYKKSNYLKYILSIGITPEKQLERFINFEIERIKAVHELSNYLNNFLKAKPDKDSKTKKFVKILLMDVIDLKKHLILKAVSILTGFKIDDVYDSNILLHDIDLDNYILEYIESSVKHTKEITPIFESGSYPLKKSKAKYFEHGEMFFNEYKWLENFLPEISGLARFCFRDIIDGSLSGKHKKVSKADPAWILKEADMLSLIEKIVFLKENMLFSELNINEIIHIAKIAGEIELAPNKTIIKQGEKGDKLFIIINGEVKVSTTQQRVIATLGPGSCLGELSIIDEEPRSADVVTTQKTRILSLNRKDFLLTLKDNPAISINIMQVMAARLRKMI